MPKRYDVLISWLTNALKTSDFEIKPASEDASFRTYYRLFIHDKTFIVMDAPPAQEDSQSFVSITNTLRASGIRAPMIHHMDLQQGLLLLDDFGNDLYLDKLNLNSVKTLYSDAIVTLLRMQTTADASKLADYDAPLLRNEMQLFSEWLLLKHLNIELTHDQQQSLGALFDLLVENAIEQPQVFVHRDFHSRNLMLTEINNPGVIDYQDALKGPLSYDLVSLLKDCYIKWPINEINNWVDFYLKQRSKQGLEIDRRQFQRWFDLMGVQRHLKASGIFARLFHRDGKPGYLKDIPRTLSYITDLKNDYKALSVLCSLIKRSILPKFEECN